LKIEIVFKDSYSEIVSNPWREAIEVAMNRISVSLTPVSNPWREAIEANHGSHIDCRIVVSNPWREAIEEKRVVGGHNSR